MSHAIYSNYCDLELGSFNKKNQSKNATEKKIRIDPVAMQVEQKYQALIENIFVGYRETFSDSKKILDKYSIGLAHQKVIHLLSMYEGISISKLLVKLKVTKQSLNRVLKDLIKLEIIVFKKDKMDTRIKHVYLNDKGKKIFEEIFLLQKKRIYNALLDSSSEEVINFDKVLKKIING